MKISSLTCLFFCLITSICYGQETFVDYEKSRSTSSSQSWKSVVNYEKDSSALAANDESLTSIDVNNPDNLELLNCLCNCVLPGTNFSCSFNLESEGTSPSCAKITNGPCLCLGISGVGCVRRPLPGDSECTQRCRERFSKPTGPPSWISDWLSVHGCAWPGGQYSSEPTLNSDLKNFQFCYDPLYILLGEDIPPKGTTRPTDEKASLYEDLLHKGYKPLRSSLYKPTAPDLKKDESGVNVANLKLKKGDVLLLGFGELTPSKISSSNKKIYTAPHYIVMDNDVYFFQILNANGGYFDEAQHIRTIFNVRDLSRLGDDDLKNGRPYRTYIILRKTPVL
ncbi:MAG: hypothetical protein J7L25_12375 [Deltaproteobacteria bacterium]|nr:hypothetical protein [Candidatus Tharpella aukensis]